MNKTRKKVGKILKKNNGKSFIVDYNPDKVVSREKVKKFKKKYLSQEMKGTKEYTIIDGKLFYREISPFREVPLTDKKSAAFLKSCLEYNLD